MSEWTAWVLLGLGAAFLYWLRQAYEYFEDRAEDSRRRYG